MATGGTQLSKKTDPGWSGRVIRDREEAIRLQNDGCWDLAALAACCLVEDILRTALCEYLSSFTGNTAKAVTDKLIGYEVEERGKKPNQEGTGRPKSPGELTFNQVIGLFQECRLFNVLSDSFGSHGEKNGIPQLNPINDIRNDAVHRRKPITKNECERAVSTLKIICEFFFPGDASESEGPSHDRGHVPIGAAARKGRRPLPLWFLFGLAASALLLALAWRVNAPLPRVIEAPAGQPTQPPVEAAPSLESLTSGPRVPPVAVPTPAPEAMALNAPAQEAASPKADASTSEDVGDENQDAKVQQVLEKYREQLREQAGKPKATTIRNRGLLIKEGCPELPAVGSRIFTEELARVLLEGPPLKVQIEGSLGTGKSTVSFDLALALTVRHLEVFRVPLNASTLSRLETDAARSSPGQALGALLGLVGLEPDELSSYLAGRRVVLLLDGLDRLPSASLERVVQLVMDLDGATKLSLVVFADPGNALEKILTNTLGYATVGVLEMPLLTKDEAEANILARFYGDAEKTNEFFVWLESAGLNGVEEDLGPEPVYRFLSNFNDIAVLKELFDGGEYGSADLKVTKRVELLELFLVNSMAKSDPALEKMEVLPSKLKQIVFDWLTGSAKQSLSESDLGGLLWTRAACEVEAESVDLPDPAQRCRLLLENRTPVRFGPALTHEGSWRLLDRDLGLLLKARVLDPVLCGQSSPRFSPPGSDGHGRGSPQPNCSGLAQHAAGELLELAPYLVRLENCENCRQVLVELLCSQRMDDAEAAASAQTESQAAAGAASLDACRLELAERLK